MPGVLRWLSTKLNCTSQVANLLAATSTSDAELVRGIIADSPDLGLYNTQGGLVGGRSALTIAAERGDLEILQIIYEGAVKARGEAFARQSLNAGAERGQTPLMRACLYGGTSHHVACVSYLLSVGSDPFAETDKGETCLHLAAKNAHTECLTEILSATVSIPGSSPMRLADAVLPYTPPVRFTELRNEAGFTALHLATLKNSPAAMQVLLGAGACLDAGILDAGNTPHLTRGSTALHIAAARGSSICCNVLLDFQLTHPDTDIRSIRNSRNLKASQLARLAGHHELAEMLRAPRSARSGQTPRSSRRRTRRHGRAPGGHGSGQHSNRPSITAEAVMDILIARTQLLLALREVGLELGIRELPKEGLASVQAAHPLPGPDEPSASGRARDEVAAAVAEFTNLWQKGMLEETGEGGGMLSSNVPADLQVAKLPDSIFADNEGHMDSYAAAALVQAALNAMAHFSQSAKPLDLPPTELKPTSPLAAAVVVQVAIRKLAGKKTNQTTSAATLISSMNHALLTSPGSEHRHSDASLGGQRSKSRARSKQTPGRHGSSSSRADPRTPTRSRDQSASAETSRIHVRADATHSAPRVTNDAAPAQSGAEEVSPFSSSRHIQISRRSSIEQESLPSTVTSPMAALSLRSDQAERPLEIPDEVFATSAFEGEILPDIDDPNAMPMWEGYESGDKDLEEDGNDSEVTQPVTSPSNSQGKQSSLLGQPSLPDPKLDHHPQSPPRSVPSKWREEKTDESTSACESLGSQLSQKPAPAAPKSIPLRTSSAARGAVERASVLSPTPSSASGRTSCLTPATSTLLGTNATSVTATDDEKEDGDAESDTEIIQGSDINCRCPICMDQPLQCAVSPCLHKVCYGCAYQFCSRGLNIPTCPFCRGQILTFISSNAADKLHGTTVEQ